MPPSGRCEPRECGVDGPGVKAVGDKSDDVFGNDHGLVQNLIRLRGVRKKGNEREKRSRTNNEKKRKTRFKNKGMINISYMNDNTVYMRYIF